MRTKEEIQAEITKLRELEPRIRPRSIFGTDNKAKIRAEIRVLEEGMGEEEIYDLDGIVSDEALESMLFVRQWLDGYDGDGSPSEGWAGLVQD